LFFCGDDEDLNLSGAHCRSADSQRGSQSSGQRSLAGMTKTSTCELHVTDREGSCQTSTFVSQLTVREVFCRGLPSGPERRRELRRKREESIDTGLALLVLLPVLGMVLALLSLLPLLRIFGIWNHAPESMLDVVDSS